jgi:hypothetical protein
MKHSVTVYDSFNNRPLYTVSVIGNTPQEIMHNAKIQLNKEFGFIPGACNYLSCQ